MSVAKLASRDVGIEHAAAILTIARVARDRGDYLMDAEKALLLIADQRDEAVSQLAFERAVKKRDDVFAAGGGK